MHSKKLLVLVVASAAVIGTSTAAIAAKGGNGGGAKSASIAVTVSDGVFGGTTDAAVVAAGDAGVLATSITNEEYWVRGQCSQAGVIVYEQYLKTSGGVATLQLGPTNLWQGGPAECTADTGYLRNGKWASTASAPFAAHAG